VEHSLKAGTGEADSYYFITVGQGFTDVDDLALGFKVGVAAADEVILIGNTDFQIAADGYIESGAEGGSAATQIFAGCVFFKAEAASVLATHS